MITKEKIVWTEVRIGLLRKLWDEQRSASYIAREIGYGASRNSIIGKAHRLGLSGRPSPINRSAEAAALRLIRKQSKVLAERARKPRNNVWNDNAVEILRRLWPLGITPTDIATEIGNGMTSDRVSQKAHRIGLPSRVVKRVQSNVTAFPSPPVSTYDGPSVLLKNLKDGRCLYPVDQDDAGQHLFCGDVKMDGSSYCHHHHRMSRRPSEPVKMREAA